MILSSAEQLMFQAFETPRLSESDRLHLIAKAISQGCSPNCTLASSPTSTYPPLVRACWLGSLAIILLLLEAGAKPIQAHTLIAWAASQEPEAQSLLILETLIAHGAQINETSTWGETPLISALHSHLSLKALWLLQRGANPSHTDEEGQLPLHLCAQFDLTEPIAPLVQFGADVDALNRKQETPLYLSARLDHCGAAHELLKQEASLFMSNPPNASPMHLAQQKKGACLPLFQSAAELLELQAALITPPALSSNNSNDLLKDKATSSELSQHPLNQDLEARSGSKRL